MQALQSFKQHIHFLGNEYRGGLIQNEDMSISIEGFQNFYALAFTDRKVTHQSIGFYRNAEFFRSFGDALFNFLDI